MKSGDPTHYVCCNEPLQDCCTLLPAYFHITYVAMASRSQDGSRPESQVGQKQGIGKE